MRINQVCSLLLFLIALMVLIGSAQGIDTGGGKDLSRDDANILVLADVLKGNTEGMWVYAYPEPVAPSTTIATWYGDVVLPESEGWLFFIDDAPMQSWAHPCRYVYIDISGAVTVKDALGPPTDLEKWEKIAGSAKPPSSPTQARSPTRGGINALPPCTDPGHCYAVIISGGANPLNNWERYYGDVSFMYKTLVNDYGYLDDHIIVLMSDGTDPGSDQHRYDDSYVDSNPDLDSDGDADVGFSATTANIATVFNDLQTTLETGDHLFIFTTDHGGPENTPQIGTNVIMNLWYQTITDDQFDAELDKITSTVPIMITMEQCFSGGFIDDVIPGLPGQERVIATAANAYESSWGDTFSTLWISAVAGHDKGGTAVDADADDNGVVTMQEAFNYARDNDHEAEHPQYGEFPSGIGSTLALSSCYTPVLPVANAGPNQSVEQTALAGTPVILDGSGSSDPCGEALTYSWTWPGGAAEDVNPTPSFPLGTTVVSLVVTAEGRTSEPDTVSITVVDTTPPVITVPLDVIDEQTSAAGTPVVLQSATATDICDADPLIISDAPPVFPLGMTTVTFTATDVSGNSATGTTIVTVVDTTPPVITVPDNVTVEQATRDGTVVPLIATAVDICDAAPVVSSDAPAIFPLGSTVVTFTATDASGNSATGTMTVHVIDTTPPDIAVQVTPDTLWPPNHKMVDIKATVSASDICDAAPVVKLTSITSDEPDNGLGDGDTPNDIQAVFDTFTTVFKLRAERAGVNDGRIYTITYTATDASGNSASASATVVVPKDQ